MKLPEESSHSYWKYGIGLKGFGRPLMFLVLRLWKIISPDLIKGLGHGLYRLIEGFIEYNRKIGRQNLIWFE
jgi:hypothetical protein